MGKGEERGEASGVIRIRKGFENRELTKTWKI